MYKSLKSKVKNFETLGFIEYEILNIRQELKKVADERLRLDIDSEQTPMRFLLNEKREYNRKENELHSQLEQYETKRQHKLDRRNDWKGKLVWSVLFPIVITIGTTYLLLKLGLKTLI